MTSLKSNNSELSQHSTCADTESQRPEGGHDLILRQEATTFSDDLYCEQGQGLKDDASPKTAQPAKPSGKGDDPDRERPKKTDDPKVVVFDGPDDMENPRNWSDRRRWSITILVSCYTFMSPVASSIIAPSLPDIAEEFHISGSVQIQMMLSIFILAYAVGPLVIAHLSETYGRLQVFQIANLWFMIFNLACGFTTNPTQMYILRFLAGLGGSAPLALGSGFIRDIWSRAELAKSVSLYSLMPVLAPAVGPIAGGLIQTYSTWRWGFWAVSIADAVVQILGLAMLRETYAPRLLAKKAQRLRKETGNQALHTPWERNRNEPFWRELRHALVRPLRMLFTTLTVPLMSMFMAYVYGVLYLFISTFAALWRNQYRESTLFGGLNYIALAIGFLIGAQFSVQISSRIYRRLTARAPDKKSQPEFRLPILVLGTALTSIGCFIYGWTAEYRAFWIGPDIGAAMFSFGAVITFSGIQGYLIDTYDQYAASAIAAATMLRSLAGFGFALFAPTLFDALGYGWGTSLLGFLSLGIGVPAPILLWYYGAKLRAKGRSEEQLKVTLSGTIVEARGTAETAT